MNSACDVCTTLVPPIHDECFRDSGDAAGADWFPQAHDASGPCDTEMSGKGPGRALAERSRPGAGIEMVE
jgi:hypothetical protein